MKSITLTDIRSWGPCYDPNKHLPEDWQGTVLDLLKLDQIPPKDRLWVVLREELIDAKTLRLFAVWCVRQVEHLLTDVRSRTALNVAERFAYGQATQEELEEASHSAWIAAYLTAFAAGVSGAAWDPYAAWALEAAAKTAAGDPGDVAWAAWTNAKAAQVAKLIEMLEVVENPRIDD